MRELLNVDGEVASGAAPGEVFARDNLWVDSQNVTYTRKGVRPIPGQFVFASKLSSEPVTGAVSAYIADTPNAFWGTPKHLYRLEQGAGTSNISNQDAPYDTASEPDSYVDVLDNEAQWTIIDWTDTILAAASKDLPIQRWVDGGPGYAQDINTSLGGFTGAEIVDKLGAYVLAFNSDLDIGAIHWCNAGDPTVWEPLPSNSAGGLRIRRLDGPIIATKTLTPGIMVYGRNSVHFLRFTKFPSYFEEVVVATGIGAVSKHAVASVGRVHYGFGPKGIWSFNGSTFQYLAKDKTFTAIYGDLNYNKLKLVTHAISTDVNVISWFWPSANSNVIDKGISYNYQTGAWAPLNYARTAATDIGPFDFALLFDTTGNIYREALPTKTDNIGIVAPPNPGVPGDTAGLLVAKPEYTIAAGYGACGYGHLGYGGQIRGDG